MDYTLSQDLPIRHIKLAQPSQFGIMRSAQWLVTTIHESPARLRSLGDQNKDPKAWPNHFAVKPNLAH